MALRRNRTITPERAAGDASRINAVMAVAQVGATIITGNLGFVGESAHNFGDAASFKAKQLAMDKEPTKSHRLRKFAAGVFAAGGLSGISAGVYELAAQHHESTSTVALTVAIGGAALNTVIAKRTHRAVVDKKTGEVHAMCDHDHGHDHDEGHHEPHEEDHVQTSRLTTLVDTKIHAYSDAGSGWLYVAGLLGQKYGLADAAATYAMLANGMISSVGASYTLRRINKDTKSTNTAAVTNVAWVRIRFIKKT